MECCLLLHFVNGIAEVDRDPAKSLKNSKRLGKTLYAYPDVEAEGSGRT